MLTFGIRYYIIVAYATVVNATIFRIMEYAMTKFMKMLNNISRSQSVFRSERLKSNDICAAHHTFILAICRQPGRSQEELSREICLNKSTVARAIGYLEEKGYVYREAKSDDKRSLLIYPTEKMLEILPKVRELAGEWNRLISEDIPKEELEVFLSVLMRMEDKARALTAGAEGERK